MMTLGVVEVVPNDELKDEFSVMGSELAVECAFDPVCLGRVGYDIGLDQVVIGRSTSTREEGVVAYTLDLVDLDSRSVLRYRFVEVDNNIEALSRATETQLPYLFEIRSGPGEQIEGPTGPSKGQIIAAWSSLSLGVVSLGLGIFFGLDASSTEDDVRNGALRGGNVYEMTQVQAQAMLDDASDSALLSNIFLGTGVALIGVSVLLFLITPGSDIDANAELEARGPELHIPAVGRTSDGNGWGVSTSITF